MTPKSTRQTQWRSGLQRSTLFLSLFLALIGSTRAENAKPKPGDIPPNHLGRDRGGEPVTVSQHRGKVVVVTFWASWCPPCRKELPMLAVVQNAVGREHLEVVAINFRESKRTFKEIVQATEKKVALTYVHDESGKIASKYDVNALPMMFIVDRDGRIAHVHQGYSIESLKLFIKEILALLPADVVKRLGEH